MFKVYQKDPETGHRSRGWEYKEEKDALRNFQSVATQLKSLESRWRVVLESDGVVVEES
jgi:hypothetical protein